MALGKALYFSDGDTVDYTPSSAATGGTPAQITGGLVGVPGENIAAGIKGSARVKGIHNIVATSAVGNIGDNVWWDADGDPVGGVSGSGAATTIASAGDFWIGTLAAAHAAAEGRAQVDLNKANPDVPHWPNRVHETVSDDLTLDVEDIGKVLHVDTDAKTITLAAVATGLDVIIINDGADAGVAVNISPDANDKIHGQNIAGTDNKDLINTKTTAIRSDWVHLNGDVATGLSIVDKRGIWATES